MSKSNGRETNPTTDQLAAIERMRIRRTADGQKRMERLRATNPRLELTEADRLAIVKRLDVTRTLTAEMERLLAAIMKQPRRPAARLAKLRDTAISAWWVANYTKLRIGDLTRKYDALERYVRPQSPPLPLPRRRATGQRMERLRVLNAGVLGHELYVMTGQNFTGKELCGTPPRGR
jgi:hypothetical protein